MWWGDYLGNDGQGRTLMWKQTHDIEPSFQEEGTSAEKTPQKEGPQRI